MGFVDWWLELAPVQRMAIVGLIAVVLLVGLLRWADGG